METATGINCPAVISPLAIRYNISPSCQTTTAELRPSMSSGGGSGPSSYTRPACPPMDGLFPVAAVGHLESKPPGFGDILANLTQDKIAVVRLERSIFDRELAHFVIAHEDLGATAAGVPPCDRVRADERPALPEPLSSFARFRSAGYLPFDGLARFEGPDFRLQIGDKSLNCSGRPVSGGNVPKCIGTTCCFQQPAGHRGLARAHGEQIADGQEGQARADRAARSAACRRRHWYRRRSRASGRRQAHHVAGRLAAIDDLAVVQDAAAMHGMGHRDGDVAGFWEPPLFMARVFFTPFDSSQEQVSKMADDLGREVLGQRHDVMNVVEMAVRDADGVDAVDFIALRDMRDCRRSRGPSG